MAEIRKHDPAVGNALAQALRAAMGETIRPVTPGEPAPPTHPRPEVATQTSWVSLSVTQPAAPELPDDED